MPEGGDARSDLYAGGGTAELATKRVVFTRGVRGDESLAEGSTTVEVRLTADGSDTIVELVHRDLPADQRSPPRPDHEGTPLSRRCTGLEHSSGFILILQAVPWGVRNMAMYIGFHEVDDVDHWLHSPKRQEIFGPLGITGQLFTDPAKSNRVGLILDVPDMEAFQQLLQSQAGAEAMEFDGVRPETIVMLEKASDHV